MSVLLCFKVKFCLTGCIVDALTRYKFIPLDKMLFYSIQKYCYFFFFFSTKTYVVDTY